jgi:hypothetical protein
MAIPPRPLRPIARPVPQYAIHREQSQTNRAQQFRRDGAQDTQTAFRVRPFHASGNARVRRGMIQWVRYQMTGGKYGQRER